MKKSLTSPDDVIKHEVNSSQGFTLVEIMVAMIILSLLASGIFSVFVSAGYLTMRSKRRFVAAQIARLEIENKRQFIRADLWYLNNATNPLRPNSSWFACNSTNYSPYSVDCRVDNATGSDYRKLSVRVRWNETQI
jgi:prepilin-type N-terminal cleavage/methylation domain-containing protein